MNHLLKRTFSLLLALVMCLSFTPILPIATYAADSSVAYEKVTEARDDWSGTYLIVYEAGSVIFDGNLTTLDADKNNQSVSISDSAITGDYSTYEFTIAQSGSNYSIKSASGYYIGANSNKNSLNSSTSTVYTNTISISADGTINIIGSGGAYLRYNASSGTERFRYYKSSSYTNQKAICLYERIEDTAGGDTSCTHANITTTTVAATCTEAGSTTVTCNDCGETISTTSIEATGHSYVDDTCSSCGEAEPAGYVLTDLANITSTQNVIITMSKGGTVWALSSANGTSSAPTAVEVTVENNVVTGNDDNIYWNIVNDNGSLTIYPAGDTSKWLYCTSTNNGVRVGTNANKVFTVDASSGYLKNTATSRYLGVYTTTPDWRCYTNTTGNTADQTLAFYVLKEGTVECQHTKTELIAAVAATCTTAGNNAGIKCADCGFVIEGGEIVSALDHSWNEGEVTTAATCTEEGKKTYTCTREGCGKTKTEAIAATGHSYIDGVCTVCGTEKPAGLDGEYYIAAKRSSGNYFYMTNDLGTASAKRYQAVDSGLTELPALIVPSVADTEKVFTLSMNDDGTYIIGAGADSFLGWTSGNSGALVAADAAKTLTIEQNTQTGTCKIYFANDGEERVLSLNNTSGNDYFAFYAGTQVNDLVLIPVKNCVHTDADSNEACDVCGKTIIAQVGTAVYTDVADAIAAAGNGGYVKLTGPVTADVELTQDLYLDLAGHNWNGTITTGSYTLYGMDSTTDDYDCTDGNGNNNYGTISKVVGNVELQYKTSVTGTVRRYLTYTETDGSLSFHRIYLGVTSMSLRPSVTGVGYKAIFCADTKAQSMLNTDEAFGYKLWLFDKDGNELSATRYLKKEQFVNKGVVTLRLQEFDIENYGEKDIYAEVYLKLANGTVIDSYDYSYTLCDMLAQINSQWNAAGYTDTQKSAIKTMCEKYATYLRANSQMDNILGTVEAE